MKKINNQHPSNFWFGFSLGTIAAVSAGYLLGTKKGREFLKKLMPIKIIPFLDAAIDQGEKNRQKIDELLRNS